MHLKSIIRLTKLLYVLLIFLFQGCSPLGDPVDTSISKNHYYSSNNNDIIYSSQGNWFELGKSPLYADAKTFKVLNEHIGKDKNHAYFKEHKIAHPNLDFESFHASTDIWMWNIGLDNKHVYYFNTHVVNQQWTLSTTIIAGAKPDAFIQYDAKWSKDGATYFFNHKPVSVAYNSFENINRVFAKDSNHIYVISGDTFKTFEKGNPGNFEKVDDASYAKDDSHIYFFKEYVNGKPLKEPILVPYKNPASIKVVNSNYLFVDDAIYFEGRPIPLKDRTTFQVLSTYHSKDNSNVYYEDSIIKEADSDTFHYDETIFRYRDKNHIYDGGQIRVENQNNTN